MSSRLETQALRKRMLVMRAELERQELASQVETLRDTTTLPALFRSFVPRLAVSKGLPVLVSLFKRYPFLSSGASLVFSRLAARFSKPLVRRTLALGGLGFVLWQGWQLIQKIRFSKDAPPPPV